jgi:hypothetical protein
MGFWNTSILSSPSLLKASDSEKPTVLYSNGVKTVVGIWRDKKSSDQVHFLAGDMQLYFVQLPPVILCDLTVPLNSPLSDLNHQIFVLQEAYQPLLQQVSILDDSTSEEIINLISYLISDCTKTLTLDFNKMIVDSNC